MSLLSPFQNLMTPVSRAASPAPSPSLRPSELSFASPQSQPPTKQKHLSTEEYEIACLQPTQVDAFLDHLHTVFHILKPNGSMGASRALFKDHWDFDPARDPGGVFVAIPKTNDSEINIPSLPAIPHPFLPTAKPTPQTSKIVSSVRVYNRHMHLSRTTPPHATGGIGDVATNLNHRGKSLAKKLMHLADEYMHVTRGYKFGVLHAAPLAAPIYASIGWVSVPMRALVVETDIKSVEKAVLCGGGFVDSVVFEKGSAGMQVCRVLHAFGAPSVLGSFARESEEYWVDYVGKCSDPRRSVVRLLFTPTAEGAKALQVGDCVGYAISEVLTFDLESIKKRVAEGGDVGTIGITIKEVFVGKVASLSSDGTVETVVAQSPQEFGNTLSHLVKSTIDRLLDSLPAGLEESLSIKLNIPAAVLPLDVLDAISNISSYEPWWKARELVAEDGWMFKVFESFSVACADGADAQIFTAEDLAELLKPVGSSGLPFIGCEGVILKEGSDVFGFLKTDAF